MSKILKSFGLAALLVALLAGTGMAEDPTANVAVTGEVEEAVLTIETSPTGGAIGTMKYWESPANDTDSIGVITNLPWKISVVDDAAAGKMAEYVSNAYVVEDFEKPNQWLSLYTIITI